MTKFWQTKTLFEMNQQEWESICDGCAKCCLLQLQDTDSDTLVFTDVACDLLQDGSCRCSDYANRSERVPQCMTLTRENVAECAAFAPPSCSYRLLLEDKPLPDWHHLQTADQQSIHRAGRSVAGRFRYHHTVANADMEEFVVEWPLKD